MNLLVRYLRYSDGREEDIEITQDGLSLVLPISTMKDLVRQHELFIEREKAEKEKNQKECTQCRYCVQQDDGYSNYTVEGTTCDCLLGLNNAFPKDRFYGADEDLLFATKCEMFKAGDGPQIDVDREEFDRDTLDPDIRVLFDAWEIRKGA